jgi:hypothetical protein
MASRWLVIVPVGLALVAACASSASDASYSERSPETTIDASVQRPVSDVSLGGDAAAGGSAPSNTTWLCGADLACDPDDPAACADFVPEPDEPGDTDGGADASDEPDAGASGSFGDADAGFAEEDAGQADVAPLPKLDAGDASSESAYACRLAPTKATATCGVAGARTVDESCVDSSDCAPGLACVGDAKLARCLPHCCGGDALCKVGTFCAERPLRQGDDAAVVSLVPVCVPVSNCDLSSPYPCTDAEKCTCGEGEACMVVRGDGSTSCVVPGMGRAGDSCPCAWGHVCSLATNTCLKLCQLTAASPCGAGRCQSAAHLPAGWGVCIGSDEEV